MILGSSYVAGTQINKSLNKHSIYLLLVKEINEFSATIPPLKSVNGSPFIIYKHNVQAP